MRICRLGSQLKCYTKHTDDRKLLIHGFNLEVLLMELEVSYITAGPEIIFRVVLVRMTGNYEATAGHSNVIPVNIFCCQHYCSGSQGYQNQFY